MPAYRNLIIAVLNVKDCFVYKSNYQINYLLSKKFYIDIKLFQKKIYLIRCNLFQTLSLNYSPVLIECKNYKILKYAKNYGLILSAGLSERMGKFKPLLSYKGKSFIQNVVVKMSSVCDKIIIVTGHKANEVLEDVSGLNISSKIEFVFNSEYEKGMFTSLQAGLQKAGESEWVLYHLVDQPGLPDEFYKEFVQQIDDKYNWVQPKVNEHKGHPVLIHKSLVQHILSASGDSILREVSNSKLVKKKFWECRYEEIFQDIDTEEDYSGLK